MTLEELEDKGRNVAANLAAHTGKARNNTNTRMLVLEDYALIRKISPAKRSGLYEITERGKAALVHRDQYDHDVDFKSLIE